MESLSPLEIPCDTLGTLPGQFFKSLHGYPAVDEVHHAPAQSPMGYILLVFAGTPVCWLMTCNGHSFLLQHYGKRTCVLKTPKTPDLAFRGHDLMSFAEKLLFFHLAIANFLSNSFFLTCLYEQEQSAFF